MSSNGNRMSVPQNAIAIIGMSGRFPGAPTIPEFWNMLCRGDEGTTVFSDEELLASGVWSGSGVLGPEAFDAVPFLDLLGEYGESHGQVERE